MGQQQHSVELKHPIPFQILHHLNGPSKEGENPVRLIFKQTQFLQNCNLYIMIVYSILINLKCCGTANFVTLQAV